MSLDITNIGAGWWTCPACGNIVSHGTGHACGHLERQATGHAGPPTGPDAHPPLERIATALEQIATLLDRSATWTTIGRVNENADPQK